MKMIVVNIQIVMICKIGRHLCTSLHIEIPDQHIHHNERADKHEDNDMPCVTSSAAHAQQTDRDKTLATKKRHRHKQKLILVPGFNPLGKMCQSGGKAAREVLRNLAGFVQPWGIPSPKLPSISNNREGGHKMS
jgi:hypothetical protein